MEIDDVLADEMVNLCLAITVPVGIEVESFSLAIVGEAGHVAYGRIEPDVKVLAGRARDLESKVGSVTGNVPLLELFVEPFTQLVGHLLL